MPNEQLIKQASRHSIYVQRFAGHLANLFDPYTEKLQREMKIVLAGEPTTQNIRRINQLIAEYRRSQVAIYNDYNETILMDQLREFSGLESEWELASLKSVIKSESITLIAPAPAQVWAGVNAQPLIFPDSNGVRLLSPFIKDWEKGRIDAVSDIIRTGFITGRTTDQIVRDIAGKNGYLDNQNRALIKTMVRTATNHVSNVARQKTMEENDDIVIGYEIIATLDRRTSDICRGYDGVIVKFTDKVKPMPPFHPNCRTGTAPVLDERFAIDKTGAKRASVGVRGGGQVDADTTYYSWLKNQGKQGPKGRAFVRDVLGNERADLFLDGGLSVSKFKQLTLDQHFQPIPLKELRKKQTLQLAFDAID